MILWLSGTVEATTLSAVQMANHKHSIEAYYNKRDCGYASGTQRFWQGTATGETGEISGAEGASSTHTHGISITSAQENSIPPYYSLSYIVRIM